MIGDSKGAFYHDEFHEQAAPWMIHPKDEQQKDNNVIDPDLDPKSTVPLDNPIIRASQVEKGNINLNNRPRVMNDDGSISTVRSITVGVDGGNTAVIPTVHDDGYIMSNDEAIKQYQNTGKHLGIFDNLDEANGYAQQLHLEQADQYLNK